MVSADRGFDDGPSGENGECIFSNSLGTKLCNNVTTAQSFVNQTRSQITVLSTNGSFTNFLQNHAQAVAYLQNTGNDGLISTNCTGYFTGLQAANTIDVNNELQIRNYTIIANNAIKSILFNIIGYPTTPTTRRPRRH